MNEENLNLEQQKNSTETTKKEIFTKNKLIILIAIFLVIIIGVILIIPSHFERVKNKAVEIAGQVSSRSDDDFTIDTYPYEDTNMDSNLIEMLAPDTQKNALEAIKYVNEEFDFGSYVYDQMLETTAIMGLQSEENDKYKVTWKYHPKEGLEVTYYKK